ncbi:zinc-binding alcohol dehydrogenase family protein [Leptospira ilyithenensis]|uniref:Zinc-type alcohol dehydrogenase-like protein n=1 Tax=Leptospira ilyithenensis TaxID=2484901 RepID=A0A4V3JWS5_9LEPT|nr:zinc-binding alcohol dehydrogenase family protein [Leptospira ilyithenensis]TGN08148.1 zinc-binding alcohol dehydrogenase family protein [Leptospira ilyithenensis]
MNSIAAIFDPAQNKTIFQKRDTKEEVPGEHDVRVEVKAISVNPVDYKVKSSLSATNPGPRILGWDVSGTVVELGSEVKTLHKGMDVYYAGAIQRPGGNSKFHIVDEFLVSEKPKTLSYKEAAALPLTTITAFEAIFHKLKLDRASEKNILIVGGAGGVGSIAIQILKQMTKSKVIVTAGRKESGDWVKSLGADTIIDYRIDFSEQLKEKGIEGADEILCFNDTDMHYSNMAKAILPFGNICSIVETKYPLDLNSLKQKSAGFLNEFMFTRSLFQTADRIEQQKLLTEVGSLVDKGKIKSTQTIDLGDMTEENLESAHKLLLEGNVIGKIVLGGLK